MKASAANFLKFLQGTKQFIIPIYQRTYSWTLKQCEQLWTDVRAAATDDAITGHFIGSVVYIEKGIYMSSSVTQLLVIDGQQRLTTLLLMLAALGRHAEAQGADAAGITRNKIENPHLFNIEETGDDRYKLILT